MSGTHVKYFDSTMPGAPVMSGTVGAMIAVLDACLVNGFGSQAPAGWLKAFAGINKAAYKINTTANPESPAMLVCFDDTTTLNAKIAGYESMSDVDTGTGMFPTIAQQATGLWVFKSYTASTEARSWIVIATDKIVYVGIHHRTLDNASYGPCWFCFGDFDSKKAADTYGFVVSGNITYSASADANASSSIAYTSSTSFAYLARSYTGVGSGVAASIATWPYDYGGSGNQLAPLPYPNPSDYGLYLCPADLMERGAGLRGRLPGMLMIPHNLVRKICPNAATGYFDSDVPALPGKTVGFFPCAYSNAEWGVVAFDLTGPWEH